MTLPTVRLGGMQTLVITRQGLADLMVRDCLAARADPTLLPKLAFSSNGESVAKYNTDPQLKTYLDAADYIHADGMSVVIMSHLLTRPALPERIATTDWFHDAARAAQAHGLSFYFLGGPEEDNKAMVEAVAKLYPNLKIAGRHHDRYKPEEEAAIVAQIKASKADVLWLSVGRPRQEQFCLKYREALRGVGWFKTCGGLFKYVIGKDPRAPGWMQALGLEWVYRGLREPRRLGWRYLTTNPKAFWFLLTRSG